MPRTLKGFRDYLPEVMIPRERIMEIARETFRSFGFAPIDTPALELLEVLSGKGSDETDRQLYKFTDNGGRDVGMRFDLTVPLARFAAQHISSLPTPFKRYHIAPVWRGENTQAGRYREFVQCDFDTIGTLSVVADIEMVVVIDALMRAIGFDRFTMRLNNRAVLSGLLEHLGIGDQATLVLRALDKLQKIGSEQTIKEMVDVAGVSAAQAESVIAMAQSGEESQSYAETFARLHELTGGNATAKAGIDRLQETTEGAIAAGVDPSRLRLDVSIARGLDYYTGVIVETFLNDLPSIGSVCSGGRYDNLAGLFTKQHLPGIGASLGLDRLLAAMQQLDLLPAVATPAPVLIAFFDASRCHDYLRMASELRQRGVRCEMYPDAKKLGQQLKYADEKGFQIAIIAGNDEWSEHRVQVKDLRRKIAIGAAYSHDSPDELVDTIQRVLRESDQPSLA
ncbi:MAG: histidine--tRNA ligase [Planctomycetaceae bacterium]